MCLQANYIILDMVSRTLCVCTCMCVLSLLAGTLTLLKLLFYGHCESLWFSELLLLFFPPSLAAGCILCHKRFCEGLCSGYGVSNLNLHFGPPAKSLLALSKKGVKKEKEKKRWKKTFWRMCVKQILHLLPLWECHRRKEYLGSGLGGKTWKDTSH